ncbi:hypothetical protein GCM10011506_46050 [Marivirga lumbricoides]|uniref:Uncharacterized protein n=1 Tax=Marivirga lumbricoides TaxID=1046115 RepID=A0ABQ1N5T9_9BACT|nr:hypothetical protein GCM10011506_46050 [Marivirga lumbricoides]
MPKPITLPTLFDNTLKLNISKLKEWGYLEPNQIINSNYKWTRNGSPSGSIAIFIDTCSTTPFIELDYKFNNEPRRYRVYLTAIPSNLNNGEVYYFICPHTNKRCRILYQVAGYFYHREAFKNAMYDSQTLSKKNRSLMRWIAPLLLKPEYAQQLNKKYFKKTYSGKPTKRYLKLLNELDKAHNLPPNAIEIALIS